MLGFLEKWLDLLTLIWLFPVVFIIHDMEEIITVQQFVRKQREKFNRVIPKRLIGFYERMSQTTTEQFAVAVLVVLLFVLLATFSGSHALMHSGSLLFFFICMTVFLVHVFTHVMQSILLRALSPGVVTSVLLVLPYSSYVFYRFFKAGMVDWHLILTGLPWCLLIIPVVLVAHGVGRLTYRSK